MNLKISKFKKLIFCIIVIFLIAIIIKDIIIINEKKLDNDNIYSNDYLGYEIMLIDYLYEIDNNKELRMTIPIIQTYPNFGYFDYDIDHEIKEDINSWLQGDLTKAYDSYTTIHCQSTRYLSLEIVVNFPFNNNSSIKVYDYLTFDMETGKRVMLNDLVEVNEEFVEYIKSNEVVDERYLSEFTGRTQEWLNSYSDQELFQMLCDCSKTKEQLNKEKFDDNNLMNCTTGPLLTTNSFYVKNGYLVLCFGNQAGLGEYIIPLENIECFLKVKKW